MPIMTARRIRAMGAERYAKCAHIDKSEANVVYAEAVSVCNTADAKRAVAKLNELATEFNTTTTELIAMFS